MEDDGPASAAEAPPVLTGRLDPRTYHVLAVDDDPDFRAILERVLSFDSPFPCVPTLVDGPARALEELAKAPVDVVLCDYRMPEEDGISFLTRVKQAHPTVVRMLLTAHTDLRSILGALVEAEVQAYLEKPLDAELARYTLYDLLLRRQLERAERPEGPPGAGRPATSDEILAGTGPRAPSPGEE
jgi:DNA-binding NtrC family response regulator